MNRSAPSPTPRSISDSGCRGRCGRPRGVCAGSTRRPPASRRCCSRRCSRATCCSRTRRASTASRLPNTCWRACCSSCTRSTWRARCSAVANGIPRCSEPHARRSSSCANAGCWWSAPAASAHMWRASSLRSARSSRGSAETQRRALPAGFRRVTGPGGLDAELPSADVVVLSAPLTPRDRVAPHGRAPRVAAAWRDRVQRRAGSAGRRAGPRRGLRSRPAAGRGARRLFTRTAGVR